MRRSLLLTVMAATLVAPAAVQAQETGLHTLHAIAGGRGKACMTGHEHYGESLPSGTKGVAMKTAINNWQRFTADEYGKSWGSYAAAAGKRESCSGAAPSIVCKVYARPCRSGR